MIGRSTSWNEEIRRTAEDTTIVKNNTPIRRKRDPSDAPITQRSGVRSITLMDMIWKSAQIFWIIKMPPLATSTPQDPRRGEHH
jgi:hypothetical protein